MTTNMLADALKRILGMIQSKVFEPQDWRSIFGYKNVPNIGIR
jgi:hypothetical protein